ncbi:MAG: M28 family peptidase [Acidobacteriota bacterium]
MKARITKRIFCRYVALLAVLIFVSPLLVKSQQTPFLSDEEYRLLANEISGDIAYEHIRLLTQWHRPSSSPGYHQAALYIKEKAEEYGLQDVKLIEQESRGRGWFVKKAELWVLEPEEVKVTSYSECALAVCSNSRSGDVSAELVDVGNGTSDDDYKDIDVASKIVLASGSPYRVMEQAVWKRGALGIVMYNGRGRGVDYPDQIPWSSIPYESRDKKPGTFGFSLSYRQGLKLKELLANNEKPVKVGAVLETEFIEPGWQEMVEGIIPGSQIHDQDIVFTAHIQEEKFSANDDATGCANGLEIARAFVRLIKEGKMNPPVRDIRFWWVDEISSEYQYFKDHPEERSQFLANINQDMAGADLRYGGRIQNICLPPYSLPSFLSDVTQGIIEFMVKGNTSQLSAAQAGSEEPFSKPVIALLGSREPYRAAVIPFHGNTDHMVFTASIIGIPGISFTNWPDDYIHSSDDDLWNVDRTQLQRNALAAAAIMYCLAYLDESRVPTLIAEVYGSGLSRIGRELKLAMGMLHKGDVSSIKENYKRASNQLRQAFLREEKALDSISVFVPANSPVSKLLQSYKIKLMKIMREYQADLDQYYCSVTGEKKPPALTLSAKEKELSAKVPEPIPSVKDYLEKRREMRGVRELHNLMSYEILNFVDGKNSYLDIFNAVSAESLSAGEFYYGKVTLEMVEECLNNALEAGLITLSK